VIVANPPSGVLGKKTSGAPNGVTRDNLVSASTTLTGTKTVSPNSASLIARSGGIGNAKLGGGDGEGTAIDSNGDSNRIGESANDFSVDGGLDRDTVRRIIQSYRSQVRACYDRALVSSPNLQGRVVYRWKILSDGRVDDTSIQKATLDSANLKSCVLEVIQRMQFPKSTRGLSTTVIYPFVFQGLK
jgi:TonB family protein